MTRRFDLDKINLEIDHVDFWGKNNDNQGGMKIYWNSGIGFGELTIIKKSGGEGYDINENEETLKIIAAEGKDGFYKGAIAEDTVKAANDAGGIFTIEDLEYMDSHDDRAFTNKILQLFTDKLNIIR